jgi:hypothetical protein
MEEPTKETVIIVHGTWAAPKPEKRKWYQPIDAAMSGERFTDKLNVALQQRGSPARCWAHCTDLNSFFQWSGENSWIARTRAASALADYVTNLQSEGWRCHIVAHSHGGNVVVEALPLIKTMEHLLDQRGKIVTLGTPFMDTMSPILQKAERTRRILNIVSWISYGLILLLVSVALVITFWALGKTFSRGFASAPDFIILMLLLYGSIFFMAASAVYRALYGIYGKVIYGKDPTWFAGKSSRDWSPSDEVAQRATPFLAIGSLKDEAWQLLHHMQTIADPIAVRSGLINYLYSSVSAQITMNLQIARIKGAKSYHDLEPVDRVILFFIHITLCAALPLVIAGDIYFKTAYSILFICGIYVVVSFLRIVLGETFYSAFLSPFRWCTQEAGLLKGVFTQIVTYAVRYRAWSILQSMAMGLDGYRFTVPVIEQRPSNAPEVVKYENMPRGAEERALAMRNAWISRHFSDVSETFSKAMITAAEISSLLDAIEADQTLVHAAYYTDDECIARIADWIAGLDDSSVRLAHAQ